MVVHEQAPQPTELSELAALRVENARLRTQAVRQTAELTKMVQLAESRRWGGLRGVLLRLALRHRARRAKAWLVRQRSSWRARAGRLARRLQRALRSSG